MEAIERFFSHTVWRRVRSLRKMAEDLIRAAFRAKRIFADDETFRRRIAICEKCDRFDPKLRQCKVCGCFMDVKAKFYAARCYIVEEGEESRWPE